MPTGTSSAVEGQFRRILYFIVALTVAGAGAALFAGGVPGLTGFVAGAVFSTATLLFLQRTVAKIGASPPEDTPVRQSAILLALRYFIFGACGYAIVNYFGASIAAILAGCFVAVAAVILEILYELIYART